MSGLPQSIEEMKTGEIEAGTVINGLDSPNLLSVDSTEPITTDVDILGKPDESSVETPEKKEGEEGKTEDELKTEADAKVEADAKIEADAKAAAETKDSKVEKDSPKVTKRIGKLTKQWRTAERERDFLKGKLTEAENKLTEMESKIPAEDKPLKEDYDDEDLFIEALVGWSTKEALRTSQTSVTKQVKDKDEQQAVAATYVGLDDVMEKGKESYDDFNELVLSENLIISPDVTQILLSTETPEDILHYLASNPEESERISGLDPVRIGMEIVRIEMKLEKEAKTETKTEAEIEAEAKAKADADAKANNKPNKKLSNAPNPIVPVVTEGVIEKDPNTMNAKEYRAWREGQKK
jgi:hypothetical protein